MAKKKKKKKRSMIAVLAIEVFLVIILLAGVQVYRVAYNKVKKIPRNDKDDYKIETNEGVKEVEEYRNIAFFGVDTRDNSLERGNTDTIMVASINNKNKDVKLASIYRDTYVNIPEIGYRKINAAYANGGYSLALNTINKNFDLNIKEYVTVNFRAVVDTIDRLGGITIEVKDNEVKWLNGYVHELNKINGTQVPDITGSGTQTLNGTQATAYARIRYTSGGDFKRTERQRIVLSKIFEKVKSSKLSTINSLIDEIFPQTLTNLTTKEIMDLATDVLSYDIIDQTGFPFEKDAHTYNRVSYVFPINLEDNVIKLHQFLFEKDNYLPTQEVKEYSAYIEDIRNR